MMKNLLLTLFTVLIASASFSQVVNDIEFRLLTPAPGATQGGTNIIATYTIKNLGPATIMTGDTMFTAFYVPISGGSIAIVEDQSWILTSNLNVGDSVLGSINAPLPAGLTYPTSSLNINTCGFAYAQQSSYVDTGANFTNNQSCYVWATSPVSIDEKSINEEVNISTAYGILNIASANEENYSYSVYSMAGQVISQGSFVNSKEVNMTGVAKGIYAVVVSNGTEKITKKIAIQ